MKTWVTGTFIYIYLKHWRVNVTMFNATFNNISVISWWSVLLVEETGVSGENYRLVTSHWQTLSHNVVHPALIESSHWQTLSHNVVHLSLIGIWTIRVCWYWHYYYERSKVTNPNYCDNYYYLLLGNLHFRGSKKDGEHILVLSFNVL